MPESQFLSVIRVWAATAWADGAISDKEADALRRLIAAADLDDAERVVAYTFLDAPVALDRVDVASLSEDARRGVYRAACRLAVVDREVAAEERAILDRLRVHIGIPEDVARELEAAIPGLT